MKKMIWQIPAATLLVFMKGKQQIKAGYYNYDINGFEEDYPVFTGGVNELRFSNNEDTRKLWAGFKMRKVNYIAAEGDVVVIGIDRYDTV